MSETTTTRRRWKAMALAIVAAVAGALAWGSVEPTEEEPRPEPGPTPPTPAPVPGGTTPVGTATVAGPPWVRRTIGWTILVILGGPRFKRSVRRCSPVRSRMN